MRFLVFFLASFFVNYAFADSFQEQLSDLRQGEEQEKIILEFATLVSKQDTEKAIQMIWPVTRQEFGEDKWRKYIKSNLYSFFKGFNGIDSYKSFSPYNMEHGNTPAIVHFGYIRDSNNVRAPYEIVAVTINGQSYIANIYVGTCRQGHHPICE
jgi:hypothetical protein